MKKRQRKKLVKKHGEMWVQNQEIMTKMGYPIAQSGKPISGVQIMSKYFREPLQFHEDVFALVWDEIGGKA
jgi:hypothetical protein